MARKNRHDKPLEQPVTVAGPLTPSAQSPGLMPLICDDITHLLVAPPDLVGFDGTVLCLRWHLRRPLDGACLTALVELRLPINDFNLKVFSEILASHAIRFPLEYLRTDVITARAAKEFHKEWSIEYVHSMKHALSTMLKKVNLSHLLEGKRHDGYRLVLASAGAGPTVPACRAIRR